MPFPRPALATIIDRIKGDFETRLTTGKLLASSFLSIMASAYGGAVHLLHGHIEWASKQLFPDTAEKEFLDRWASIWGVKRTSASFATGTIRFTGTDGSVIPSGTRVKRSDGAFFVTTASGSISSGQADIAIKAVNAGIDANSDAGIILSMTSNIAGVNTDSTVQSGGISGGVDSENDASLRARVIERIQTPPHGGNKDDYKMWAKEVNGVTRVWVYPLADGSGSLSLTFVKDGESDIIPDAADVLEVQNYIDRDDKKPITADVTVFAPTAVNLNFTIDLSPDTAETRAAVEASLKDLIKREAEPGKTMLISKIREAVSIATGENNNVISSPSADVTYSAGEIAVFGAITWT